MCKNEKMRKNEKCTKMRKCTKNEKMRKMRKCAKMIINASSLSLSIISYLDYQQVRCISARAVVKIIIVNTA